MSQDRGKHMLIRKKILRKLKEKSMVISSHEGRGDIVFFREVNGGRVYLAEPDIVVLKDGHVLVIEIELGNSPKRLLGVAFAVDSSEKAYCQNKVIDIGKKSLLLVLDPEKLDKRGSGKPLQIKEIKSLIQKQLEFEFVDVVSEKKALKSIHAWMEGLN